MDVEQNPSGEYWGRSARVRVTIDISRPLRGGVFLKVSGREDEIWISIQYKKLPDFCYCYGMIGTSKKECEDVHLEAGENQIVSYEAWFKGGGERGGDGGVGFLGRGEGRRGNLGEGDSSGRGLAREEGEYRVMEIAGEGKEEGWSEKMASEEHGACRWRFQFALQKRKSPTTHYY